MYTDNDAGAIVVRGFRRGAVTVNMLDQKRLTITGMPYPSNGGSAIMVPTSAGDISVAYLEVPSQ
jgi:hypothetical protein